MKKSCTVFALAALSLISTGSVFASSTKVRQAGGASFSGVPSSVVAGIQPTPPSDSNLKPEQYTYSVKPGQMLHSSVSRQFLNRIITPFNHPIVRTTSPVKLETVGQSVFVALAPSRTEPVVLYIMDQGDSLNAISLMLDAKDSGPVEITLQEANATGVDGTLYRFNKTVASKFERSSNHDQTLTTMLRVVGEGKVPPGYSFRAYNARDAMPTCNQHGLSVIPRQVMDGEDMRIYVGAMTDTTDQPIEFQESQCAAQGVVAVASWPGPLLQPHQSTEVYIVVNRDVSSPVSGARPSALPGGAQ